MSDNAAKGLKANWGDFEPVHSQLLDFADQPYPMTFAQYQELCKRIAVLEERLRALEGDGK